ncbi:MAG: hypothetical protein KDM64_08265 [Verrucomicrobiae bacterium]|nr:hypothetical protein [Verrucomicrobiae bacterium]
MMPPIYRRAAIRLLLLGAVPLTTAIFLPGCTPPPVAEPPVTLEQVAKLSYGPAVEQFQEPAGVKVSLSAARLDAEWVVLRASYAPTEEGYHLYSKDMPKEGIDGTGRPTRLEIAGGAIQVGTLLADREPHDLKQYDQVLPVYPEGPVTLYRLVRAKPGGDIATSLTYMACSSELCNAPVENAPLGIQAP